MRLLGVILLSCCSVMATTARGETTFPYTARVSTDDAEIRSGPGRSYYMTDKAKRGQEVTVYRHDAGGWCAIRPVDGSFAWVDGRYLRIIDDHVATVTADDVPARVGSRLSRSCDVIQVRLRKGETVEVIEMPKDAHGDAETWVKIAPPSGEFRWISADALGTSPSRNDAKSVQRQSLSPKEFEAEYEQLEFDLSAMVIDPPSAWSLSELHERANWLLDEAQTAIERGRARLLANRIARFEDIKQRQEAVLTMRDPGDRERRYLARSRSRDADNRNSKPIFETDGRYDGVGRLVQVTSPKPGAPRYALTNANGDILCYVTPTPGVNLREYLGRDVGVVGTRGYMPEQRVSHIAARHVAPLEGTMPR